MDIVNSTAISDVVQLDGQDTISDIDSEYSVNSEYLGIVNIVIPTLRQFRHFSPLLLRKIQKSQ